MKCSLDNATLIRQVSWCNKNLHCGREVAVQNKTSTAADKIFVAVTRLIAVDRMISFLYCSKERNRERTSNLQSTFCFEFSCRRQWLCIYLFVWWWKQAWIGKSRGEIKIKGVVSWSLIYTFCFCLSKSRLENCFVRVVI